MEKRIAYYTLTERGVFWPENLADQFKSNLSRFGVMYFEEGSETETEFVGLSSKLGITMSRRTILKCTGKDLYRYPFHYLIVQDDRDYYREEDFIDFGTACDGGGEVVCRIGAKQNKKITIDTKKSRMRDIMGVPHLFAPPIYLISRRLKQLLDPLHFTGYELVPCLELGRNYSSEEVHLTSQSTELDKQASCFQLIITSRVLRPPNAGTVRVFSRCPACNAVSGFLSETEPYFRSSALNKTDFQISSEYISDNAGQFSTSGELAIISARVLRLLIENKLTGLTRYLTDPPIQYGIVEIR